MKLTLVSVHLTDICPDGTGKCATFYNHSLGGCWGEKLTFKTLAAFDELKYLLSDIKNHFPEEFLKGILNEKATAVVSYPPHGAR